MRIELANEESEAERYGKKQNETNEKKARRKKILREKEKEDN